MADPVFIIPDNPLETDADFGFSAYIDTISDLIANGRNKTPLVIGIYGKWGSGKTTLMRSIAHKLKNTPAYAEPPFRRCKPVWFQAWKYKDEDEILAALLEQILNTMARDDFFSKFKKEIETFIQSLNPGNFFSVLLKKYTGVDTKELFQELAHKKKLGFYDEFERSFKRLIWTYLSGRPQFNETEVYKDENGALTVFIDDLDRCPKTRIVGVLETIKLFMDISGCVFVIGADNEIITRALENSYQENAGRFMDKIIQVTFNLPKKPETEFSSFIDRIMETAEQQIDPLLKEHLSLILPVLENNPRNFKRFLNDFSLQKGLVTHKEINVETHLLLWNIIEKGFPSFYQALKRDRGYFTLEALIKVIHEVQKKAGDKGIDSLDASEYKDIQIPDSVAEFVKDRNLISVVKKFNPSKEELEELKTLSAVVEPEASKKEAVRTPAKDDNHRQVPITAGEFLFGEEKKKTRIDHDYEMDIYPVTNQQFKRFIKAGGYKDMAFWGKQGEKWQAENQLQEPIYWNDKDFNDPEQPVVGVSWFEAQAYANWLSTIKDDGFTYRLSTEEEWERAARGDDGNVYPWGDQFDPEKCNSEESGRGKPNRVNLYPNGISPYGCYDMAGNVWEWTCSFYDDDKDTYVIKGGAFRISEEACRCAFRLNNNPDSRSDVIGFRCARIKTLNS